MSRLLLVFVLLAASISLPSCKKQPVVQYGQLEWKDEVFYLNGQPFSGIAQDRHPNGQLRSEYPMKNGKPHGVVREWWDNGQPSTETNFENGERHGRNRYWNREGRQTKEQMYDHGKSISEKVFSSSPAPVTPSAPVPDAKKQP